MVTTEEKKSWQSQIYNNWVTTVVGVLVIVNMFIGWELDVASMPRDIRDLKETAKIIQSLITTVAEQGKDIAEMKSRMTTMESNGARKDELLIRMDERLKSIQERLGLKPPESK